MVKIKHIVFGEQIAIEKTRRMIFFFIVSVSSKASFTSVSGDDGLHPRLPEKLPAVARFERMVSL